jgi:NAD(P)H-quinone oxidoreductase subunit 5
MEGQGVGWILAWLLGAGPLAMKRLSGGVTGFALLVALCGAVGVALGMRGAHLFAASGPFWLDLYFDVLSAIMLLLVTFLGVVVTRYAYRYLEGDAAQSFFLKWLCVTIGAVLTLLVSGNLLMFTAAWMLTSFSLHKLLTFYPNGHWRLPPRVRSLSSAARAMPVCWAFWC